MSEIKTKKDIKEIKIGFISDELKKPEQIDIFHDSTFALMLSAQKLNAKILLTDSKDLKIVNNKVIAKFDEIITKQEKIKPISIVKSYDLELEELDIVFARKDPPINESFLAYIQTLCILSHTKNKPLILNSPEGILKANEKLYALNFPQLIPFTLVSANKNEIYSFLTKHKEAVIKPLYDKGGSSVFYLNKDVSNCHAIIEASTLDGSRLAMIQEYIPQVVSGDKRIILLNGNPIGAMLRIPKEGELRANMNRGASVKHCELSKRDLEICEAIRPSLQKDGLYFTGIDVIGNYLIEVNVTSPTGLQEIERFTGKSLSDEIINWAMENVHYSQKACC